MKLYKILWNNINNMKEYEGIWNNMKEYFNSIIFQQISKKTKENQRKSKNNVHRMNICPGVWGLVNLIWLFESDF